MKLVNFIFSFVLDFSLWTTYLKCAHLYIHWKRVEPHWTDKGDPARTWINLSNSDLLCQEHSYSQVTVTVIEDDGFKDEELEEKDLNKTTWTWTGPTVLPARPSHDDGGDGHDVEVDGGDDDNKEDAQRTCLPVRASSYAPSPPKTPQADKWQIFHNFNDFSLFCCHHLF